jgi:outer membrane protein OmpU
MKAILFASTALVAFAGAAAAQGVTLSGSAEMGIFDDGDDSPVQFHTDIDVTFTLAGETDSGLIFGANIDLDETDTDTTIPGVAVDESEQPDSLVTDDIEVGGSPAFDNDTQGGEAIFLSGAFGTLSMGDTDGALDWATGEVLFGSGSINDNEEHGAYSGVGGLDGLYDGQIARYEYVFGDFGAALSVEVDDSDEGDEVLGIGFRYNGDFGGVIVNAGLGYQEADDADSFAISVNGGLANGFQAGIVYENTEAAGIDGDYIGIGAGYSAGAFSVGANYGRIDTDAGDTDGFGLDLGYDLGSGLNVLFGYGYTDADANDDEDFGFDEIDNGTYSFGVSMSF